MTLTFPAAWKLSPMETALLSRLAHADKYVTTDELDAAIQPHRQGQTGRPVKVVLHYLRKKVARYGITVINRKQLGYELSRPSMAAIVAGQPVPAAPSGIQATG